MAIVHYINSVGSSINKSESEVGISRRGFLLSLSGLILCAMDSARFATVMFMFRHQGRVRVALSEEDAAGGGVDRLFDNALAAGAEDFDQVPGADRGVEVEVRSVPLLLNSLLSHDLHLPGCHSIDYMCTEGVGKDNRYCYPIWLFTGFVVQ